MNYDLVKDHSDHINRIISETVKMVQSVYGGEPPKSAIILSLATQIHLLNKHLYNLEFPACKIQSIEVSQRLSEANKLLEEAFGFVNPPLADAISLHLSK